MTTLCLNCNQPNQGTSNQPQRGTTDDRSCGPSHRVLSFLTLCHCLSSQLPALALLALLVPHLPLRLGCRFSYYSLVSPTLPPAVAVQAPLTPSPSGWLSCFSQPPRSGIRLQMLNCKYLTLSLAVNQNQGKLRVRVTAVLNLSPSISPAFFSCVSLPLPSPHSGLSAP